MHAFTHQAPLHLHTPKSSREKWEEDTQAANEIWEYTHTPRNTEPTDYTGDPQQHRVWSPHTIAPLNPHANISSKTPFLSQSSGVPWYDHKCCPSTVLWRTKTVFGIWDYWDDCGCLIKTHRSNSWLIELGVLVCLFSIGSLSWWLTRWCVMSQYWKGTSVSIQSSYGALCMWKVLLVVLLPHS